MTEAIGQAFTFGFLPPVFEPVFAAFKHQNGFVLLTLQDMGGKSFMATARLDAGFLDNHGHIVVKAGSMYRLAGGGADTTQQPVCLVFQGVDVVQCGSTGYRLTTVGGMSQLIEVVANAGKVAS